MVIFDISTERNVNVTVTEKVYQGDNKISQFHTNLPSVIGDEKHDVSTCTCEMRCYILDDDYISYNIPTASLSYKTDITIDITEKAQTVPVMFIFEKDGVIVAKTKRVSFSVSAAPPKDKNPLAPRDQFDRIINEQRETIAEQADTITEQVETITSQGEWITELNGEVQELTVENEQQAQTIARQNTTIDQLNRRVPPLEVLEPINPSQTQRTYTPESPNIGFPQVVVNAPTAEGLGFDYDDLKEGVEFLGRLGTYNPFPEHSYGGIYYTELGEGGYPKKILIKDILRSASIIPQFFNNSVNAKRELREVVFENCPEFLEITTIFVGFNYLTKVILPNSLTVIGATAFQNCTSLMEIKIPDTLTSIGRQAFIYCTSLTEINLPQSLTSVGVSVFQYCASLTNLTLAQGFNCNGLNVSDSTRFAAETIVSCLEALADRTGQTAYTITFGTKNLNKLTAEQKAIAINKNWNLA